MVVSKRCKICALIHADNVPITGEYFGKVIPDIISKICGIEVDLRKANGVLVCQMCIIQLMHVDMFIDKLQNAMQRLKINVREAKPKTPAKVAPSPTSKKKSTSNKTVVNGDQGQDELNERDSESFADDSVIKTEKMLNDSKKSRRKSVFHDEICSDTIDCNESGTTQDNIKFKKIIDIPTEKTSVKASKRKHPASSEINKYDSDRPTPTKNNKEESPMNLTIDEQNGNNEKCEKVKNCILCGKTFHANSALRDHIETAHMGERLKACPHCSSEFRSKQKYESHVFSEKCKTTIHACQYVKCNKRFKTVHKMELHMLEKHSA